jgi:hypothetical protein
MGQNLRQKNGCGARSGLPRYPPSFTGGNMRKLHLDLDDVQVESFATAEAGDEAGTVQAHVSLRCTGGGLTCDNGNTCVYADTCGDWPTCYVSCHGTCPNTYNTDCQPVCY